MVSPPFFYLLFFRYFYYKGVILAGQHRKRMEIVCFVYISPNILLSFCRSAGYNAVFTCINPFHSPAGKLIRLKRLCKSLLKSAEFWLSVTHF